MVRDGRRLLGAALALARDVRDRIEQLPGLHVLYDELLTRKPATTWTACTSASTSASSRSAAIMLATGCGNTGG
jgi:hypothetical protein